MKWPRALVFVGVAAAAAALGIVHPDQYGGLATGAIGSLIGFLARGSANGNNS